MDFIDIIGITPAELFPICPPHHPHTQFCQRDILCLPEQKPPMECILQIIFHITIQTVQTIHTPAGKKVLVDAIKHIKVVYTADEPAQSVHAAHFDIPFCFIIKLKSCCQEVKELQTAVEYIGAKQLDSRCLTLTTIIFACPALYAHYPAAGTKTDGSRKITYNCTGTCRERHSNSTTAENSEQHSKMPVCSYRLHTRHSQK